MPPPAEGLTQAEADRRLDDYARERLRVLRAMPVLLLGLALALDVLGAASGLGAAA